MKFLYGLRKYLFRQAHPFDKQNPRKADLLSLDELQTVGLIFEIRNEQTVTEVLLAVDDLQALGKTVTILGYTHSAEKELSFRVPFFSLRDTTFSLHPNHISATDFMKGRYDLLVAFAPELHPQVEYVVRHTKAICKSGIFNESQSALFDFMIQIRDQNSAGYFFKQLTHYLQQIRK